MRKGRRLLAGICALALTFSFTPVGGYLPGDAGIEEAKAETSGDWEYEELETGTVEITGYTGTNMKLKIPAEIEGKKVTGIGMQAFFGYDTLTSVTIPEGVTSIGDVSFCNCSSLTEVKIPKSVTDIAYDAFENTPWLQNQLKENNWLIVNGLLYHANLENLSGAIAIPQNVTRIGDYIFAGSEGVDLDEVGDKDITAITIPDGVTSIGNYAFYGCSQLGTINISESVISIGSDAFEGTLWLSDKFASDKFLVVNGILCDTDDEKMVGKIQIPADVKVIGDGTFSWCRELTEVVIPEGVTEIGNAFSLCEQLEEVSIPASVTMIGESAFVACTALQRIIVADKNKSYSAIDGNLYNKAGTELIRYTLGKTEKIFQIPDGVVTLRWQSICTYGSCEPNFSEVIVPESVQEIEGAFEHDGVHMELAVKGIKGSYAEAYVKEMAWHGDHITFQPITWDTPKLSKVESVNGGIKLSWEKVYGAAQYRVFYQQDGKWVKLADTAETDYIWKDAESGMDYTFTVRCLRKDGKTYTSDYDAAGITYAREETPEPPNQTVTENNTFGDAVTKKELHDMVSLYLSAIHMADCELESSGMKPGASRQKVNAHFFQTAPSPEDVFAYCCYSGISKGYELTKAEDGTDVYVIPYRKAIAFAKKLFANLPSMKEMIDMPILLGKYDAKQDSFILPYGGGGVLTWVSEIAGYQAVSGNIYEIYCKVSKMIVSEDPDLDMNDESQYIKCKFTAKKTGKNWKLISFEGVDKFPESYGKVPKAAEDSDTGIILTANEDVIPAGSRLEVQSVKEGASFDLVAKALETSRFEIFDIKLLDGNTQIQPNGMVQVTIPLPEGYDPERTVVYHIDDQGVKTKLDSLAEDGFVVFETDHFSLYVLAEEKVPSESGSTSESPAGNQPATTPAPGTGDRNPGFFWMLLLAAGAAACICCRTRKRSCHSIK